MSFDNSPPMGVPARFLLTAPLFSVAFCLLLLKSGPQVMAGRWQPATLALVHLFTLGVLAQVMIGALLQFLPVAKSLPMPGGRWMPIAIHVCLNLGTVLLAWAFLGRHAWLFLPAAALLAGAFGLFVGMGLVALLRPTLQGENLGIFYALAGLLVTALLGVLLAAGMAGAANWALPQLVDLHAGWGLAGAAGMLILGVAPTVVPMFLATPAYAPGKWRLLASAQLLALVIATLGIVLPDPALRHATGLLGQSATVACLAAFAGWTLWLQTKRRRREPDISAWLWRTGMLSLLAFAGGFMLPAIVPSLQAQPAYLDGLALLFLFGYLLSVLTAMLYKILPFLVWIHWQAHNPQRLRLPNTIEMARGASFQWQFRLHAAACLLLPFAGLGGGVFYAAALVLLAGQLLLAVNLFRIWRTFLKGRRYLRRQAASGQTRDRAAATPEAAGT